MNKIKKTLFLLIIISMTLFLSGLGCGRPQGKIINLNKEMAALIPIIREEAPLINEKMEILRLGLAEVNEYSIDNRGERFQSVYGH